MIMSIEKWCGAGRNLEKRYLLGQVLIYKEYGFGF
jgi:hypothetical protein|tara:strand:- start:260 stop:364 length:105 start_codon:yes stop_codon:yes gene_type:complete